MNDTTTPVDAGPSAAVSVLLADIGCQFESPMQMALSHLGWHLDESLVVAGLRWLWVEGGAVLLTLHGQAPVTLEAGQAAVFAGSLPFAVAAMPTAKLPWLCSANWPTTAWLEAQLVRRNGVYLLSLRTQQDLAFLQMMRRVVQDTAVDLGSAEQKKWMAPAAKEMGALAVVGALRDPAFSPMSLLLNDRRLGGPVGDVLLADGKLPSVDVMSERCHVSRASFTKHFRELTGFSYSEYVTVWRMTMSMLRFVRDGVGVETEASRYGYEAEAAFRKAFARCMGRPPGQLRRSALQAKNQPAVPRVAGPCDQRMLTLDPLQSAKPGPKKKGYPTIRVTQHSTPPDLHTLISNIILGL